MTTEGNSPCHPERRCRARQRTATQPKDLLFGCRFPVQNLHKTICRRALARRRTDGHFQTNPWTKKENRRRFPNTLGPGRVAQHIPSHRFPKACLFQPVNFDFPFERSKERNVTYGDWRTLGQVPSPGSGYVWIEPDSPLQELDDTRNERRAQELKKVFSDQICEVTESSRTGNRELDTRY